MPFTFGLSKIDESRFTVHSYDEDDFILIDDEKVIFLISKNFWKKNSKKNQNIFYKIFQKIPKKIDFIKNYYRRM